MEETTKQVSSKSGLRKSAEAYAEVAAESGTAWDQFHAQRTVTLNIDGVTKTFPAERFHGTRRCYCPLDCRCRRPAAIEPVTACGCREHDDR